MNCIIIDDDIFVRKITEDFVKKTKSLTLQYSLSNATKAVELLSSDGNIDLIFLDIEMPGMTGIDFLNALNILPQVIIISSKEKYAINAFEYDVTDYLLKPFNYNRFCKAVERALERQEKNRLHARNDEIFIKHNTSLIRLKCADILWVEAMENYITINTATEKYTILYTMNAIEKQLPQNCFMRVQRSFIVNINHIHSLIDNYIHIKTGSTENNMIPIGKVYKEKLLEALNILK
jgi:DNA-binding LytR/AlgR family response regulator